MLALASASCGYTTRSAALPGHVRTVGIPVFENETAEHTIEQEITDAVIQRFVQDNQLRVVDPKTADVLLLGRVLQYRNSVFGVSADTRAQEYRVSIRVGIVFKDQVKNREIWSDPNIVKTANYYVEPVPGQTPRTEIDGRTEAIQKIADEILSRSVQSW